MAKDNEVVKQIQESGNNMVSGWVGWLRWREYETLESIFGHECRPRFGARLIGRKVDFKEFGTEGFARVCIEVPLGSFGEMKIFLQEKGFFQKPEVSIINLMEIPFKSGISNGVLFLAGAIKRGNCLAFIRKTEALPRLFSSADIRRYDLLNDYPNVIMEVYVSTNNKQLRGLLLEELREYEFKEM